MKDPIQTDTATIGEREAADKLFKATAAVIAEGKYVTYDLGGTAGPSEMAGAIVEKMKTD